MLELSGLNVSFNRRDGSTSQVLAGVDLQLRAGEIVGLAGESGSGKSTTALSLMGTALAGSTRNSGALQLGGTNLFALSFRELTKRWGPELSYVAQGAGASLNPLRRIEFLLTEPIRIHLHQGKAEARSKALELLAAVGIPQPAAAIRRYPHEFSGGQQQRIALAIALACDPEVLLLDEPTSGLDVTTQAQINALLVDLVRTRRLAALCISHDLAALGAICDQLVIMYGGEVVERGPAQLVLTAPRHPYSAALMDAIPKISDATLPAGIPGRPPAQVVSTRCSFASRCRFVVERCNEIHPELADIEPGRAVRCLRSAELGVVERTSGRVHRLAPARGGEPLLSVEQLTCAYGRGAPVVLDATFAIEPGTVLALVGESGSGKSTVVRTIAGLHPQQSGAVVFDGAAMPAQASQRSRALRRDIQLIFQSADASLNPRHTIASLVERPLTLFDPALSAAERRAEVERLLTRLNLDLDILERRPHELSGGQRQRVAIARAFAARPRLLLCDEVTSALDVSVAATVLESLVGLVDETGVAMLFVTHNLAIVPAIADAVVVMKDGRIVEAGPADAVIGSPRDPYTQELLRAAESGVA